MGGIVFYDVAFSFMDDRKRDFRESNRLPILMGCTYFSDIIIVKNWRRGLSNFLKIVIICLPILGYMQYNKPIKRESPGGNVL